MYYEQVRPPAGFGPPPPKQPQPLQQYYGQPSGGLWGETGILSGVSSDSSFAQPNARQPPQHDGYSAGAHLGSETDDLLMLQNIQNMRFDLDSPSPELEHASHGRTTSPEFGLWGKGPGGSKR